MKQAAKDLILLALWLVCNQYIFVCFSAAGQENKLLSGKAQAGTEDAAKLSCVEGEQKVSRRQA